MRTLIAIILLLTAVSPLSAQTVTAPAGTTVTQKSTQVERIDGFEALETQLGLRLYLEIGTEVLIAMKDNKIQWRADVIGSCGKPAVGPPRLRYFQLVEGKISVTYGKACGATIDPETGKISCTGCD